MLIVRLLRQVIGILRRHAPTDGDRRTQALAGQPLCQQAFRKLLGLGSARFMRLRLCARTGRQAPVDGRTLPKKTVGMSSERSVNRQRVVEYLEELIHTLSEPMAEATDQPVQGLRCMAFRRNRGRRPKLAAMIHRKLKNSKAARQKIRLLPPGTFSEYLEVLRARWPGEKISLKLFMAVPSTCMLLSGAFFGPILPLRSGLTATATSWPSASHHSTVSAPSAFVTR